jgi:hypothetical protein
LFLSRLTSIKHFQLELLYEEKKKYQKDQQAVLLRLLDPLVISASSEHVKTDGL